MTKKQYFILSSLLFIAAFILRYFSLETNGLWIDELWSAQTSAKENSVTKIIELCMDDTHPPLFDILLHYCLVITNNGEFTGRYLALIFGILGVLATPWYTFKITQNKTTTLLALAIITFNYFHIIYSFEGRFYSLMYLFSLIIIAELLLFINTRSNKHLVLFSITTILFLYTHYYGGILLFALSSIILLLFLTKQLSLQLFLRYCLAAIICFVCFLPWFPKMLAKKGLSSWMSTPNIGDFFNYFYLYTGKNPFEFALLFIPLLLFYKQLKKDKVLFTVLCGTIFIGFLVPFIVSQISTPMLHHRYTFIYFPAIVILAAHFWSTTTITSGKVKKIGYAIVLLSIVGNLFFLRKSFYEGKKDPWKEIAHLLSEKKATVIVTENQRYLNYYLSKKDSPLAKNNIDINSITAQQFWFVQSAYDQKDIINEGKLRIIEQINFPQYFILYKVEKKK